MFATPTMIIGYAVKTGTLSLESYARRRGYRLVRPHVHRMIVPDDLLRKDLERIFIVRNPYDRLVSIYWELNLVGRWQHRTVKTLSFVDFLRWLAANECPTSMKWNWNLSRNANIFRPDETIELKHLPSFFPSIGHSNSSDWSKVRPRRPEWTRRTLKIANINWCYEDCERFGYDVRS